MADDSLRNYGIAAPHGPNMTGEHTATANIRDMNMNEKAIFDHLLLPDDSYDETGTYWADMNIMRRAKFTNKVDSAEVKKEFGSFLTMFKNDPFSPVGFYIRNMVIPGAGLLLEGYVLFSIGNVKPLFQSAFPDCWDSQTICDPEWQHAVEYLEVVGIIIGQILVGFIGDWVGRRWGLIQDAVIMFVGLLMLTASWGVTQNGWVICYAWSLFFYGIGVGGEYPMTATSGMENAVGSGKVSTREDRLHRGRKVTSAFLMQGWGQFFNQIILIFLLLIFHGSGNPPYGKTSTQWTYRISFAIPAVGTFLLIYYRAYKMKAAGKQLTISKKKGGVTGYDVQSLKLTFHHFGFRILATAGAWFCNDVFFYGNKLFQSEFIKVLSPDTKSVMVNWLWNLCNVGVALVGYYLASFLIDNKLYGRKWMMIVGFFLDFVLFIVPAFNYEYYTSPAGIGSFQAMYFLSSFFNQFGPNSVTFIVAAEVYPTSVRATAHGFSAAWGKAGALLAAVVANYTSTHTKFYYVPWFGLAGALLTFMFMPDTTGLDLKEQERRWKFIREGREHDYHGVAIHPKHLSLWERMRGVGKHYDPSADYELKMQEMRGEWEDWQVKKHQEHEKEDFDDSEFSDSVSAFFERTNAPSLHHDEKAAAPTTTQSGDSSDGNTNEKTG